MSKLLVEERSIVIPGEEVASGMDFLPGEGSFREGDSIYANRLGLFSPDKRMIKVIPLKGKYLPKVGDNVIGVVSDVMMSAWRIDFGWAFLGGVSLKDGSRDYIENGADLTKYYKVGDVIFGKITKLATPKIIDITLNGPGLRKLTGGRVISCNPAKVPRIIGKQGSMIALLKENTGCSVLVGQNGKIWIKCDDSAKEVKVVEAIRIIEKEAHLPGLTDKINAFLKESK